MSNTALIHLSELHPDDQNARRHNERNLASISTSITETGFGRSLLAASDGTLIAGNATAEVLADLDMTQVIVVESDGTKAIVHKRTDIAPGSDMFRKAAFYDNRTAELADWDLEVLAALMQETDIAPVAMTQDEAADLIAAGEPEPVVGNTDPDDVPEPPVEPTTRPGDLWRLGEHRLLCGDSTKAEDVARLMAGELASICFTSPPYATQRQYGGNLQPWDDLMQGVFRIIPMAESGQVLVNLGLVHEDGEYNPYWEGWREWMRQQGWRRFGWYVWDQGSGLPGDWNGRLAPSHEFIFHFNRVAERANKTKATKLSGQQKTGKGLRKEDGSVSEWTHVGRLYQPSKIPDSVIRVNRHSEFMEHVDHPAVFPVQLANEVYAAFAKAGALAFEPFAGAGTSVVAAESLGMRCRAIELNPVYADVIVRRWEAFSGGTAELERAL